MFQRKMYVEITCCLIILILMASLSYSVVSFPFDRIPKGGKSEAHKKIKCRSEKAGIYTITAENLTIRVSGGVVPHFHFWYTIDNKTVYHVKFVYIAEFLDRNNDSAFQHNETVKPADILPESFHTPIFTFSSGATGWNFSGFYNITQNGETVGIGFNYTLNGTKTPVYKDLYVELRCKIYYNDTKLSVPVDGKEIYYNLDGGAELKVDVIIGNWPWLTDRSMLALRWDITWDIKPEAGEPHEPYIHSHKINVSKNMTIEHPIKESVHTYQTSIIFRGAKTNQPRAHFSSLNMAKVCNETSERTINVTASYRTDGEALQFYICYPYFGDNTLEHDPIMGVFPVKKEDLPVKAPNVPGVPSDALAYNFSRVIPKNFIREIMANRSILLHFENSIILVNSSKSLKLNLTIGEEMRMHYFSLNVNPAESLKLTINLTSSIPKKILRLDRDIRLYIYIEPNATVELNATLSLYINKTALEQSLGRELNVSRLCWAYWNGSKWILSPSKINEDGYLTTSVNHFSIWTIVEVTELQLTTQLSKETVTQGETVTITVTVRDEDGNPVTQAIVLIEVDGESLQLSEKDNGQYEGIIDTKDLSEGTYSIKIEAQKAGYISAADTKDLTVIAKGGVPWMLYGGIAALVVIAIILILYITKMRSSG